jgi:hypothetical protein
MAPLRARRWPSRSPTGGTCGTTWPKQWNAPSPGTAPACKNHRQTLNPRRQRLKPHQFLSTPGRTDQGPARRRPRRASPRPERNRDQPHFTAGRQKVRHYATAATADELTGGARLTRPALLGPHQDWLRKRWDEGVRSTERLHAELRDRGHRGSLRTLRRVTARLRQDTAVPAPSQVVVAAGAAGRRCRSC